MLKKYSEIAPSEELKFTPTDQTLMAILNYSKSVQVKKTKSKKVILLNLN